MPRKKKTDEFEIVYLTNAQIADLKREIASAEKMLNDPRPWVRNKITDEVEFLKDVEANKQTLRDFSPKRLRGAKQNRAFKEAKELAAFIKDQMPGTQSYYQRYPKGSDGHSRHSDFERTVQQQVKFQTDKKIQRAVTRYKNIMRRLDPDDPTITNVEALRDGIPPVLRGN
ncbi:MAG: hypothetical protein ACYS6W_16390 [Planctomycetota bacterium]|jgi:hypothetical protein